MEKQKNISCEFATWVSNNLYEDTYQDLGKDGMTWTCLRDNDDCIFQPREEAKRYTIEEIYSYFLIERMNNN